MARATRQADLVLSGGGVLGIGHVGVAAVLEEHGYSFARMAGTSAGSIMGALLAAGMPVQRMHELIRELDYRRFRDRTIYDRVPLVGPAASVLFENGVYSGAALRDWLAGQLDRLGVRTFGDLRDDDAASALPEDHRYRLVVMAADVTRGELVRLPWDYHRYGLDPDRQLVADAVRASTAAPYLFEPTTLHAADGTRSLLVDGGVISNYPLDIYDRGDGGTPRWPTFGVTLVPRLPANLPRVFPSLGPLRRVPPVDYAESLLTTIIVGRDQGYLDHPWVAARSIEVDGLGVDPFDFNITPEVAERLYESGRAAAERFLGEWDWPAYAERYRAA